MATAEAQVFLGGVLLSVDNQLEEIPLGEELTAGEEILSDGTRRLVTTGVQTQDIVLSGTLMDPDDDGTTPLAKRDALLAMLRAQGTHLLQWPGHAYTVQLRSFVPIVVHHDWVRYTLTLFRPSTGALAGTTQGTGSAQQTAATSSAAVATFSGYVPALPPVLAVPAQAVIATGTAAGRS